MDNEVAPVDHFWCSDLQWISKHVIEFLEWILGETSTAPWWAREAQSDLDTCWECVLQYHSLVEAELESFSVEERQKIFTFDRKRLKRNLADKLKSLQKLSHAATLPMEDVIDLCCDDEQECIMQSYLSQDAAIVQSSVSVSLQEVLMYPQYLHSTQVACVFVPLLSALIDSDNVLNVTDKMAGIYMLLVHPDQKIQKWAVEHVRDLGTVTAEEYDDRIDEAVRWVFSVAQNSLLASNDALPYARSTKMKKRAILSPSSQCRVWDRSAQTVLPSHLFSAAHPKVYWLGMCMLLKALDGKLLRREEFWQKAARCGLCTLADAVVQTIQSSHFDTSQHDCDQSSASEDDDTLDPDLLHSAHLSAPSKSTPSHTAFWPAVQCFIMLVDRLGTCFWKYVSYTSVEIIQMLVSNQHYRREVAEWLKCDIAGSTSLTREFPIPFLSPSHAVSEYAGDNSITCSQMVYDWNSTAPSSQGGGQRSKRKKRRGQDEVLQWCEPLVCSLVQHSGQQVLFEAMSLIVSHLRGLYDDIVRASPGKSPFQLSSRSALVAQSLAQLWKAIVILFQSKQFQLVKTVMSIKEGDVSATGASHAKSSWLSLVAELVTEAAATVAVDGSRFASPSFLSHQQVTTTPYGLPECVPPACQVVMTLLEGLYSAQGIVYAVKSLSAKYAMSASSTGLLSAHGTGSPLVAVTPNCTLGMWGRPSTPTALLATPSNPFTKESHHLRRLSALGSEGLAAILERSLDRKATQDTHEQFAPHFTRATSGSTSVGGASSGGGQGDQMAGDGDQWQEKEVATDARTLDMDDGSSLSSTDIDSGEGPIPAVEKKQVLKKKAKQCHFTLRLSPVSSRLASERVSKSVQTDRGPRRPAVNGSPSEESTTESLLEEEAEDVQCPRGRKGRRAEGRVQSKAKKQTGNVGHSLALRSMERRKKMLSTSQSSSSTFSLYGTESDSDFDLPKVRTNNLTSRKQSAAKATRRKSLAQIKAARERKTPVPLSVDKDKDDVIDFILSEKELAEFEDFGATLDEIDAKASHPNVDSAQARLEGHRAEKPAAVHPKARVSNTALFLDEDDEECEQEDPLLPITDARSPHTTSVSDATGGQSRAQLGKGSGGIDSPFLVASYWQEGTIQKAQKATLTLFKEQIPLNAVEDNQVTMLNTMEAAVGLPPAIPSLVAPCASMTVGPSESQMLGSIHTEGASPQGVESQVTSQMCPTETSDAPFNSVPDVQEEPEVAVTPEPSFVETFLPVPLPKGNTQSAVTPSDSDSDMSSDDTSIAVDPLGGLLSDKLKLQRHQQQVSTRAAQAPRQQSGLLSEQAKHSPAVVKSAPFSKARAPVFGSGNGNVAAKVCRKQPLSAEVNSKPTISKATDAISAHGPKPTLHPQVPSKLSSIRIDLTPRPAHSMNELFALVLSWSVDLFLCPQQAADGRFIQPAPECGGIQTHALQHVPSSFTSVSQYFNVYAPLFMLEIWDSLFAEMRCSSGQPLPFTATVESVFGDERIIRQFSCHGKVTQQQIYDFAHPVERDFVVLSLSGGGGANQFEGAESAIWRVFGIVTRMKQIRCKGPKGARSEAEGIGSSMANSDATLSLVIKVHALAVPCIREGGDISVTTVMSFTPYQRQWCALINMHRLSVARQLLYPVGGRYFGASGGTSQPSRGETWEEGGAGGSGKSQSQYNWSQRAIIESAVSCACEPYSMPRMVLLQGPPGTGKTHTIVGLVKSFFESYHKRSIIANVCPAPFLKKPAQPHLLVCAPSNAGIDEIVRRLLEEGLVMNSQQWRLKQAEKLANAKDPRQRGSPLHNGLKVIRVGRESKIHPSVLPLTLDTLTKCKLSEEATRLSQEQARLQDEMAKTDHDIRNLEAKIQAAREADSQDVSKLMEERKVLEKKQKDCQRQHSKLKAHQSSQLHHAIIRRKLLQNADIVCCTLASSGSKALEECFLGNPLHFTCTVIDEATQCCELDVLIPLRYGSSKVVLVGDPLQLPATIKSQQAKKFGYDMSLFERLYKYFRKEFAESPVKMLQVQYRMLPEICHFPSLHFYEGNLQTEDKVQDQTRPPLQPCLLFDVEGGREESAEGSSLCNPTECSLVVELCRVLQKSVAEKDIGVITPYKAQEKLIRRKLNRPNIEVGTVDGFQGREKGAIILSCVRARPTTGSIGFLSDSRRMNVALTRAKFALYIVCHKSSLKVSPDWSSLITLAEERKWAVRVTPHMSTAIAAQMIQRPPSVVRTVPGRSVVVSSHSHGIISSSSLRGTREPQLSCSSHTEQREAAKVDPVPPTSSGNQLLLHCTANSDSVTGDARKRSTSSVSVLEAKRSRPTGCDSKNPQVHNGSAAVTGCSSTNQLDPSQAMVQSEAKTTPLLKPQSRPGLLPTPPIGIKPGNLSNLGFNAGPKNRVAHMQGPREHKGSHVPNLHIPNLHSQCPPRGRPGKKVTGQRQGAARQWLQRKRRK